MNNNDTFETKIYFTESELDFHFKVNKSLRNANSLYEITKAFTEHLMIRFPDKKSTILLYDTIKQDLFYPSIEMVKSDIRIEINHLNYNGSLAVKCFLDKSKLIVNDSRDTDLISQFWVEKLKLKSILVLPIIHENKAIGVLRIDDNVNYFAFTEKVIKQYEYLVRIFSVEVIRVINQQFVIKNAINDSSVQRIKKIVDGLPIPSLTIDVEGNILSLNRELKKLFGIYENLIHSNITLNTIFKADTLSLFLQEFQKIKASKQLTSFECFIEAKQSNRLMRVVLNNLAEDERELPVFLVCFEDKHEKTRYEQEVERLVSRYKQLFDDAPVGYLEINKDGKILSANRFFTGILGYKKNELVGLSIDLILPIRFRQNYKYIINKRINKELYFSGNERIFLTKDNREIACFIEDKTVLDESSKVTGIITTVMDLTDLKKAKSELESSQERIVSLYSLSQMVYFNEKEIFEYTIEELLHLTESELGFLIFIEELTGKISVNLYTKEIETDGLKTKITEIDLESAGKWFASLLNGEAMIKNDVDDDFRISFPSEDAIVNRILAVPIYQMNRIAAIAGIANKKTDYLEWDLVQTDLFINEMWKIVLKRKSENALIAEKENLKITLDSISEGVITTDSNDRIISVNKSVEEIFEYNESELSGIDIQDFLQMLEIREENNKFEINVIGVYNILHNPVKDIDFNRNYFVNSKNKLQKIIQVHCVEIKSATNEKGGWNYFINDITDIINIEQKSSLSQKLESLGQLAAGIAHEINTPMQYINDNNRFLQGSLKDINRYLSELELYAVENDCPIGNLKEKYDIDFLMSEIPLAIEQTREGIEKVNKIIVAMKNFSHHQGSEKHIADLNYGIESTATITKNAWKYVADLELELDPLLPSIICFSDELNQVFLNMIINSAHAIEEKYGKSGIKGKIKIKTSFDEDNVIIKISDNGNGIPQKLISKVFDPFFTTKQVGKGTGQGLTIAHDIIVNKHNGKIKVDSEQGEGTTFLIEIPYHSTEI